MKLIKEVPNYNKKYVEHSICDVIIIREIVYKKENKKNQK